jgi:adenine-specific DNA-methyltransferase
VYAIPYEGEEVKLHWANADQYYIKTSEYFKNYRFKLSNGKSVCFELIEASTEQNNNKTQGDKERKFALADKAIEVIEGELVIPFTYEPADKKIKQADLLAEAFEQVKAQIPAEFAELQSLRPTEKDKQRTLLQKHLLDYTARNTFDYFIHKDLGGFLTRELDFYIKNEVLFIDDLNTRDEQEFLKQLSKIKAIKKIGEKIITFLAQLENFQKKLWLKKKMVVECNYCITLDRVPAELYAEIATNQAQTDEWIRLFAIDEIKGESNNTLFGSEKVGFTMPITVEFLKQNQFFVLDTAFFTEVFKWKLIASIEEFDEKCDGLLINSENFQALNLLMSRYENSIDCQFLDPPYNTGKDGFPYKDTYQSSSWLSMMDNRLSYSLPILKNDAVSLTHIDENEHLNLGLLYNNIFGKSNRVADIIWKNSSKNDEKYISAQHEYLVVATKDKNANKGEWLERKDGLEEIYKAFEGFRKKQGNNWEVIHKESLEFYNSFPDSNPIKDNKHYSWMDEKGVYFPADLSKPANGYYYDLIHPLTGKPCKKPAGGWRFIETTMTDKVNNNLIHFGKDETVVPNNKTYLKETEFQYLTSVKYKDGRVASNLLLSMFGHKPFDNPKDPEMTARLLKAICNNNSTIIDYFAGSGTTGHAIIDLKRFEEIKCKYILADMAFYFDSVLMPRIKKAIYSKDWKDGKPVSREGISHCFKYMRLESYEDTLNNLEIIQSENQQQLLELNPGFKEGYMLNYMLDVETQGSLLNLEWFENPFDCTLRITRNNEMLPTRVDLVETFNYLIGLVVENYAVPKEGYVVVTGKNLAGEKILVVWRNCLMHNNEALNAFLSKSKYNPLDNEFDRIYVNGDNNVENLKMGEERWKVVLIEEEFKKRMFENN